ncbi:MAG: M28 family peptidase [Taibaiella sp.]|nr:M28 family peptidase [Taibaiella sp.]
MNTRLSALCFLLVVGNSLYAQSDKKTEQQLRADIGYLASDSLEGRRTGSAGEEKARNYIIQRYQAAGIPPYKNTYAYPFHFIYGKDIGPTTQIRLGNNVMRLYDDAFPLPFSHTKRAFSEILPDVNEAGNIWMLPLYATKEEAEDPHFDWEKNMYTRSKEAATQGAMGVLFYDGYNSRYAPEFNKMSEYESVDIPVAFLVSKAYDKYVHDNTSAEKARTQSSIPVELNIDMHKSERTGTNIAAFLDNGARYTVVMGAHYDHLGRGEDGSSLYTGKDKQIHNGADDNASGTAALLQLAAWIKQHHLKHYNYLFINFSGEELGLLGSKAIIKDQGFDSAHMAYMINMDMVGRLNDSTHALTVGGIGTSPVWGTILAKPNKDFRIVADSSGVGPSDHTSFYHAGVPVLFFFTGTHHDYHKPSDDADKINYPGEVKVIKYVYSIVAAMDKGNTKPPFIPTKQNSFGKTSFKVTLGIMPDYAYQDKGVRVDGVSEGRPAIKAGLKEGDIIVQLGEHKVTGMQTYMEALGKFNKGDKTKVTVLRNGKEIVMPLAFDK